MGDGIGRSRPLGTSGEGRRPGVGPAAAGRSLARQLPPDHLDRVVILVGDPFLERDDRVVGDLDVLRADLGAALGDVAVAEAEIILRDLPPVRGVGRVHLEFGHPHQEPGPGEGVLVLGVVADHVAGVLAQEALNALAELLRPVHVDLLHPELARLDRRVRGERRDLPRLGVVERDVGDQVPDDREGAHRRDRQRLFRREGRHPGHAGQPGPPVDLHRARPALARLAVPPDGQVIGLGGLQPVQHVEDDLALVDLDLVVGELAGPRVPAPDPQRHLVAHQCFSSAAPGRPASSSSVMYFFSSLTSNSSSRSVRIAGIGWRRSATWSPSSVQIRLSLRHSGDISG